MKKQYTPEEIKELRSNYTTLKLSNIPSDLELKEKQYQTELNDFLEKNPSANEKRYIEYRIKILEKVLEEYYESADMYEGEELDGKELIDGNLITTKAGTASDYWDNMNELDFSKDKLQQLLQPKDIEANPFPLIFTSLEVYNKFIEYTRKHILEAYTDYSYLKKRLEKENLIHNIKDKGFMEVLFKDIKLINEKNYNHFLEENKLKSLSKSYSDQRQNNFNIIFEDLI